MSALFIQRNLPVLFIVLLLATACQNKRQDETNLVKADNNTGQLVRLATIPPGAEVTGLFLSERGDLFFNVQHPASSLPAPQNRSAIGVVEGVNFKQIDYGLKSVALAGSDPEYASSVQLAQGKYKVLGRSGDTFSENLIFGLGGITDATQTSLLKQSQLPDFTAFVSTSTDHSEGYLFTAWEDRPGAMSRLKIKHDKQHGWHVDHADVMNIDFSSVQGTILNCFGSLTPWGTPLTSEENYEAENTANWNNPTYIKGYPGYLDVKKLQKYLGGRFPNPYRYGYIVEITHPVAGSPLPVKLFAMGRVAHENAVVMPDKKTVYITDDGTDKGFYKFIADEPGDLTAGTLYAAKLVQDKNKDRALTGFSVSWIRLAHASNREIAAWIAEYDGIDEGHFSPGSTSYISQAEIELWAAGKAKDDRYAFLETLKAAKAMGATVEFRKMEGIAINHAGALSGKIPYMYAAMSTIDKGMSDAEGDIQLDENPCGIVYRFILDQQFNASRMEPLIVGGEYKRLDMGNQCSAENIANPDNLLVLDNGNLIIGEDSNKHANNMVWLYRQPE